MPAQTREASKLPRPSTNPKSINKTTAFSVFLATEKAWQTSAQTLSAHHDEHNEGRNLSPSVLRSLALVFVCFFLILFASLSLSLSLSLSVRQVSHMNRPKHVQAGAEP